MRFRLRSIAPHLASLAATLAGAGLGCYKPNIEDWGLKCAMDAGPKACPEGFKCDLASQRCYQNPDAAPDRPTGIDGPDGSDGDADGPTICAEPRPNCTSGSGMCDPFCRTGCGCTQKCSVNTNGALTCNDLTPGAQVHGLGGPCDIRSRGTAGQTDQCDYGLVCLEDTCGGGGSSGRCYQFCQTNADCTDAPCDRAIGGGFKVCDVPFDECVPLPANGNTGCAGSALGCWLSTTDPSRTICDCQFPPGLGEGDLCTRSRECYPGLVCVDRQGLGFTECARVCRIGVPADCNGGPCATYMIGGVANTTFGFCRF